MQETVKNFPFETKNEPPFWWYGERIGGGGGSWRNIVRSEQLDERKVGRQQRVDFTTLSVVVVFLVAAFFFLIHIQTPRRHLVSSSPRTYCGQLLF